MTYSSKLTYERILKCAKQEFMAHGYRGANMRRIAQTAKVTTGAMYNHFASKELLFDALVEEPAGEMLRQYEGIVRRLSEKLPDVSGEMVDRESGEGTDWMLEFIYRHMDCFRLIFCHSEGTVWSSYLERLIEIEEKAHRLYCDTLGKSGKPVDDLFLHITAASGFQYLVEFVAHDVPCEKARDIMENVKRFHMAGWHEILGI